MVLKRFQAVRVCAAFSLWPVTVSKGNLNAIQTKNKNLKTKLFENCLKGCKKKCLQNSQ